MPKGQYPRRSKKLHKETLIDMAGMIQVDIRAELECSKSSLQAAIKRYGIRHLFPKRAESIRISRRGYCG